MELSRFKLIDESDQISDAIWMEVLHWSVFNKDTIGKQITRSADSITANLSEALGRYSYGDRKRFAYYARGSLCETISWLQKSIRRNLIDESKGELLLEKTKKLSLQLNCYIKQLKY